MGPYPLIWDCLFCDMKFAFKCKLEVHLFTHTHEKPNTVKCKVCGTDPTNCGMDCSRISKLRQVPFAEKFNGGHCCVFCSRRFQETRKFGDHLKCHIKERPSICTKCSSEFTTSSELRSHIRRNACFRSVQHMCPFCQTGFSSKTKRWTHLNTHVQGSPCCCNQCFGKTSSESQVRTQMKPSNKSLDCLFCPKKSRGMAILEIHMASHTEEKPYFCGQCPSEFSQNSHVRTHMKTHSKTRIKAFRCHLCSRSFETKQTMDIHLRVHVRDRPFSCETCGRRFKHESNVKVHQQTHSSKREFQCHLCPKAFKSKAGLKHHKQSFHMGKRLNCEICNEKFTTSQALKYHILRHTGELQHACQLCEKKFAKSSHLRYHITSMHRFAGIKHLRIKINY